MQKLKPFHGTLPFDLHAEILIQGTLITLTYQLSSPSSANPSAGLAEILGLPTTEGLWIGNQIDRRDELWKSTCFEVFLMPVGRERYFEMNFSLTPAWNSYEFDKYRTPQPPTASYDFDIRKLEWNPTISLLKVQLENKSVFTQFNVSLTAVIEMKDQSKHYLAVTHAEEKPDFHSAKSFTLLR